MKHTYFLIICILFSKRASAQNDLLTIDEHNKYIYYQVVDMPSQSADTLYSRCLAGLKKSFNNLHEKPVLTPASAIKLNSAIIIYNNGGLAKHEEGELTYTLVTEFKDGKYRYWLSDFIFTPYQRNRYNVYERVPGKETALENVKTRYDTKTFDICADQIVMFGRQEGDELKSFIIKPLKADTQAKKINTKNW